MKISYIFPRKVREHLGVLKEYTFYFIGSDKSKKKYYKSYFDKTKSIFIHIPKCAGTSVSHTLYGDDPWHHSIKKYTNDPRCAEYLSFAILRDPVERFYSIYTYLCKKAYKYPKSIYSDAADCKNITDFFEKYVEGVDDNKRNYFLRSQWYYVTDDKGEIKVDHLLSMNKLDEDFNTIRNHFEYNDSFPKKNVKVGKEYDISEKLRERIKKAYNKDYMLL